MKFTPLNILIVTFFTVLLCSAIGCSRQRLGEADLTKEPVVTVLEHTLYKSDLEGLTYFGMNPEDSAAVVQAFVKMWVNDKLLYDKAKQNVSYKRNIEDLVEEYRRNLIINNYQTRLLKEKLSKTVSENELRDYYEKNKERFNLTQDIIQGLFIKVPRTSTQLDNFRKWYKMGTDAAVTDIEKNALQHTTGYEYFYDKWVNFNDVSDQIPEIIDNSSAFLKKNKYLEAQDSSFVYLLHIKDYRLTGSEAPFDYLEDFLKAAYTEERRETFLKELQSDLYNSALTNNQIKYYNK